MDTKSRGLEWILAEGSILTPDGVLMMAELGLFRGHDDKGTIEDKSKKGWVGKAIILVQIIWIILQTFTRLATNFPTTLFEINTVAHTICALILWAIWWSKPMDVCYPISIVVDDLHLLIILSEESHFSRKYNFGPLARQVGDSQRTEYTDRAGVRSNNDHDETTLDQGSPCQPTGTQDLTKLNQNNSRGEVGSQSHDQTIPLAFVSQYAKDQPKTAQIRRRTESASISSPKNSHQAINWPVHQLPSGKSLIHTTSFFKSAKRIKRVHWVGCFPENISKVHGGELPSRCT